MNEEFLRDYERVIKRRIVVHVVYSLIIVSVLVLALSFAASVDIEACRIGIC